MGCSLEGRRESAGHNRATGTQARRGPTCAVCGGCRGLNTAHQERPRCGFKIVTVASSGQIPKSIHAAKTDEKVDNLSRPITKS